jgi:hypothetical protein
MKLTVIQKLISIARYDRYLIAVGKDSKKAIRLYKANLRVAKAFHPVLGIFEVILRNHLDEELKRHFKDADWAINKKHLLPYMMTKEILVAEKRLTDKGGLVTNSKIIADQTLGFWTGQFEKSNFKKLAGCPIQAFRYLPKNKNRTDISIRLNQIRIFRNRINHNEPICFNANTIDFSDAESVHQKIYEVLDWIDPDARKFLRDVDSVLKEIERAKRI